MNQSNFDITLIIPPFTQLNTPYPSITYLNRYIKSQGYSAHLLDGSIDIALEIFSSKGMFDIFEYVDQQIENGENYPEEVWFLLSFRKEILLKIDTVVAFLQGRKPTLHTRIVGRGFPTIYTTHQKYRSFIFWNNGLS